MGRITHEFCEVLHEFWSEPEPDRKRKGQEPLERMDFEQFLTVVREEAGLPVLAISRAERPGGERPGALDDEASQLLPRGTASGSPIALRQRQ